MKDQTAYRILINGIVQGVGFRPFIYRIAQDLSLTGWVINTTNGVEINAVGSSNNLDIFLTTIRKDSPPLSRIDTLSYDIIPPQDYYSFEIRNSQAVAGGFQPISPDVSICEDCLSELFTKSDFRYRYPFINCTNCGPRFTIIKDIPYDRPYTTMAGFELCSTCEQEYLNPTNRRFHAQPVACPECGPHIWLESSDGSFKPDSFIGDDALIKCQELLTQGKTVAIKGLGGFHLACNAEDVNAIQRLRKQKDRPAKPLALMMPNLEIVRKHCLISKQEEDLLLSPQRPILLLEKKSNSTIPSDIAPGQNQIGVMLPYTPLHYLLFSNGENFPRSTYQVLVMTSANFSGNPIQTKNEQVKTLLGSIADYFLFHNRDIQIHCDDTVIRSHPVNANAGSSIYPIRRSRGYAPKSIVSPIPGKSVIGVGAELKNTFCITREQYAFVSQHIGDLKNLETLTSFEESIQHFQNLFRIKPELIVYDLHPDYLSSRYAERIAEILDIPTLQTQHHHAHIASCLADNNYLDDAPVIGMAFDGIGYGDDGDIWGGEILVADYCEYRRAGQIDYFHLPGGDKAIQEPWRTALSLLDRYDLPWDESLGAIKYVNAQPERLPGVHEADVVKNQLETGTNLPLTSSLGRLFDGVASLLGVCHKISYEGQAAIELEALVDRQDDSTYPVEFEDGLVFQTGKMLSVLINDHLSGIKPGIISARFHNTIAEMVLLTAITIRDKEQLNSVALSGGVWQNMTLLKKSIKKLQSAGFQVLLHHQVPANDGGISLGQAVIGQRHLEV
jgi:hydrogenase maturation protein HypF